LKADLNRPLYESIVADVGASVAEIRFALSNLTSWMESESVTTPLLMQMGSSRIDRVPKGVVFVMGAWNFPVNLSLGPCIAALAAGNCVVLKPSEVAPASAKLMQDICGKYLDQAAFRVVLGNVPHATELLRRRWDHIFYTGNAATARIVMSAAAKHLCPVTLELGGKSPCIVDRGLSASSLRTAANRIVSTGLFINAGQICVSPDYVLVHKDAEKEVCEALKEAVARMYPKGSSPEALGRIVNERHFDRLKHLVESSGGEVICGGVGEGSGADRSKCFLPPTIISRANLSSPAMAEELFGPVMMIQPVDDLPQAIEFVNSRDTPLALYVFSPDRARAESVVRGTNSGGVLVNDTLLHLANPFLPFGGSGASGMGSYHGKFGFDEFSHKRAVMSRTLFPDIDRYPPYDSAKLSLIKRVQLGPLVPPSVKMAGAAIAAVAGAAFLRSRL